jgi:putative transposase
MKRKRFTEEQIAAVLKQSEMGVEVKDLCRKFGFTEQTFYRWKKQYAGMGVSELRELRQTREENSKLKQMLQELLKKKF